MVDQVPPHHPLCHLNLLEVLVVMGSDVCQGTLQGYAHFLEFLHLFHENLSFPYIDGEEVFHLLSLKTTPLAIAQTA